MRLTLLNSAATVMNYQRIQDLELQVAEGRERLDVVEGELGLQGELLRRTMRLVSGMCDQIAKLQARQDQLISLLGAVHLHFKLCFPSLAKSRSFPAGQEIACLLASGLILRLSQLDLLIGSVSSLLFSILGRQGSKAASNLTRLAALFGLYLAIRQRAHQYLRLLQFSL